MAHATTSLAYPKDHVFALRPIYTICSYNIIYSEPSTLFPCIM